MQYLALYSASETVASRESVIALKYKYLALYSASESVIAL